MTSSIDERAYVDDGPDSSVAMDPDAAGDSVDPKMKTNDTDLLSSESSENLPIKENRIVKKAQRSSKNGDTAPESVATNGVSNAGGSINTTHKNHRRRRHARGRVQLKKGNCLMKLGSNGRL